MDALEFDGFALTWWEQMFNDREEARHGAVRSWAEMKREMRARFVPNITVMIYLISCRI